MRNKIITVVFGLILLVCSLSGFFVPDLEFSESEKRALQRMPDLNFKDVFSGDFGRAVEEYLCDQIPLRDYWITLRTTVELLTGKKEVSGIFFAKDDFLIDEFSIINYDKFNLNIETLKKFAKKLSPYKVPITVMLVPSSAYCYADKLPAFAPNTNQKWVVNQMKERGFKTIDVFDTLDAHKDEYIYYKTDHHLTSLGFYYCYAALMEQSGKKPEPLSHWKSEVLSRNFRGTNYNKVNSLFAAYDVLTAYYKKPNHKVTYNNDIERDSIYERDFLKTKDQYATFLNDNKGVSVVKSDGKGKLLVIKDSFGNCFSQFLIDDYEETHLIDIRIYHEPISEYVKKNGITEVLIIYKLSHFTFDNFFAKMNI